MLKGKDFIVFSDDWGRHPFSCQHIMRHFLPHNRLLWVHTIGLRTPRLTLHDLRRSAEKLASWAAPKRESQRPLPKNLRMLSPVMIPYAGFRPVRAFNRGSVVRAALAAMADWGLKNPILLATLPNAADYAGRFGESLTVYYCVDDFSLWPGMNQPELVKELEADMLKKADLVVATSKALCLSRTNGKRPSRLLSHGVDLEHFTTADAANGRPSALREIPGPIVGFFGLIDERLDRDLILRLLEQRPHWSFVFIGHSLVRLDALAAHPNFFRLPAVPYAELPRYAACFDVAIIPYVVNDLTRSINPLKLREYIATGRPVVATPLPEALRLAPAVRTGANVRAFLQAMEEALADASSPESRQAVLAGESWADKAELLSGWMEEALADRAGQTGGAS